MGMTVQIDTAFACPNDDIFSLPTKEDLVNAINKITQIPSKLKVEMVKLGEEITADVKEQIEDVIKTIEEFIETISKILSPYWKKGQTRNWQKEANDAITEFIQEFHIYVPTKIAEIITKIIPISLTFDLFGLSIDVTKIFDPSYQKELQDQISGMSESWKKKLEKLKQDLQDGKITAEEFKEQMDKLTALKSQIIDKFYKLIPENMRGWGSEFGVQCDEWKAKMTWQYIKTEIQELLTKGIFKVFGKLISKFSKIWKLLGLPDLSALVGGDIDVGALVDAAIKSLVKKRDDILKKLQNPNLLSDAKEKLLKELTEAGTAITDAIGEISIFGFNIMAIIGGKIDTTVKSIEEEVVELKLALKDFVANWQKKLMFDWVVIVKKFFNAIGLGAIFKPLFFTLCDLLKLIGFPPSIPSIGAIAGVMGVESLSPKKNTYVANTGDSSGVEFYRHGQDMVDKKVFNVATGTGSLNVFVMGDGFGDDVTPTTEGVTISGGQITFSDDILMETGETLQSENGINSFVSESSLALTQDEFDNGITREVSLILI